MGRDVSLRLNPELVRYLRAALPRRRALFVAGFTAAVVAGVGWIIWTRASNTYVYGAYLSPSELLAIRQQMFGRESFNALTVVLFVLLFLLAPALAGLSFVLERLRGTAIFQQMSLLSPPRLAAGKFWGSGLLAYFVAALLLPCALAAAWVGSVNPRTVLRLYLFLFVGGMCWQAVGLYASALLNGPAEKALRAGVLIGPLVAIGGAVTALALYDYFVVDVATLTAFATEFAERGGYDYWYYVERGNYWWHFYGARVPAYVVALGVMAFAGAWAFAGAVRRIKVSQLIPAGPRAPWLFFVSAEALFVGLLWGRQVEDTVPQERLVIFMLLNWAALALLAGGSALTRGRLREWWSAERDPVALFRRAEIKNALKTFLVLLGVAEAGLLALWLSYHVEPNGVRGALMLSEQFLPIAAGFALTTAGMAAFVQFCAMYRFRVGGWAGVGLSVVFYVFVTLAGLMFDKPDSTPALLNPLAYAAAVTKGDYFMDSHYFSRRSFASEPVRGPHGEGDWRMNALRSRYSPRYSPEYDPRGAAERGLIAEALLAVICFGLAYFKWTRTRAEMLRGDGGA
jgi:hypothetical protein